MKKLLIIIAIAMAFASCNNYVGPEIQNGENIDWILEAVREIDFVYDWESTGVRGLDYWQSPNETVEIGTGDCEDFAILTMYLMNKYLGAKPQMVLVVLHEAGPHYFAIHEGKIYDAGREFDQQKYPMKYTEIMRFDYDLAMTMATSFYTRSIEGVEVVNRTLPE